MDASKLTQIRMEAANTYKSNWKPRDASEVTIRNQQIANKNNTSTHQGPIEPSSGCPTSQNPSGNFSKSYTADTVFTKAAGCANCTDVNWGAAGGIQLKTCEEVSTIGYVALNPLLGSQPCGVNVNSYRRIVPSASNLSKSYTGWNNQVPTNGVGEALIYPN
jgi:hypothetical protein